MAPEHRSQENDRSLVPLFPFLSLQYCLLLRKFILFSRYLAFYHNIIDVYQIFYIRWSFILNIHIIKTLERAIIIL